MGRESPRLTKGHTMKLDDSRIRELVAQCSAATGYSEHDMVGTHLLGWIRAAERAGANIYWGMLPDVQTLRRTIILSHHVSA